MYEETEERKYIEYEQYLELETKLEEAKDLISNHEELINDLINSIKDKMGEIQNIILDTKKELAKSRN